MDAYLLSLGMAILPVAAALLSQAVDDESLLQRFAQSGDGDAFAELYRRHRRWVFLLCYRFTRSSEAAADLSQAVFVRCMEKAPQFEAGNFRGWLKTLAVHLCLDQIRSDKSTAAIAQAQTNPATASAPAERPVDDRELRERVARTLCRLPQQQKRLLVMKYFFDLSYREIQDRTGLTDDEIRSSLQNGRRNFENLWGGSEQHEGS